MHSRSRVLHSCALLSPSSGIIQQMQWEQAAAQDLKLNWEVKIFCPPGALPASPLVVHARGMSSGAGSLTKLLNWVRLRRQYHKWLKDQESSVDVFLLRYYVHDPFQLVFLRTCKKPVALVHHSLEIPELGSAGGIRSAIRASLERLIGKYCVRSSALTVGVTQEIVRHQIARTGQTKRRTAVYPNGVRYSAQPLPDRRCSVPELIFVASMFHEWHGLDLLLEAMKRNRSKFILHLVGEVPDPNRANAAQDSRIVLHGKLNASQIAELSTSCWIGLSSFGLHRKEMKEACTLKVREYLAMGLPVYSGHKDVFDSTFRFYASGQVDIDAMLRFAAECRPFTREMVATAARPWIDKGEALRNLHSELLSALN